MEPGHDDLIALVSRELRTPLHAMLGWVQMLLTHERVASDEQLSRGLSIILRNAKLQGRLIEDLLDASSVLRGRMRLQLAPVSVEEALHVSAESVEGAALAKAVRVRVACEGPCGYVNADAERLQQVLSNLLSNALEFSPRGGAVDLRARLEAGQVCLEVEDDGPGVAPERAPFVFEGFKRGGTGEGGKAGLGLGLAIARGLVELHRGTIEVTRRERGACFVVRLPALSSAAPRSLDSQLPPPPAAAGLERVLEGARVALVDAEPEGVELLRAVLERAGARVMSYPSAAALLACPNPVDVLVADLRMEGAGVELLDALRARALDAPAIALIGQASPRERLRALQAGYRMHLSKPVDGRELVVTIASVLGRFLPSSR